MISAEGSTSDERLRRIEAVTDAALSLLDADELLDRLLDRVRELLAVDTAVVLLLDGSSRQLVATSAKGLEEEVRAGFRLPVGRGFAGRVAAERRPVVLDAVNEETVANPLLYDKGLQALLGVPMVAVGDLVGVLHVGVLSPRRFTDEDVHLLQLVAERAALAIRAQSGYVDRTAGLALQRSLLPTVLPLVPGVELAARYLPGHHAGVGGDWYDVFRLPHGEVGVVVGDVAGHGLQAAVVMGRLRSALRAYALDHDDPAEVLTRLDRKVRHFEAGSLATVVYAVIAADRTRLRVTLGGHLPPVMARPGRPARLLKVPTDRPLGIGGRGPARRTTVVPLPEAATVVFYTDGLVERRGELIDEGLRRLCAAVRPAPAEVVCRTVLSSAVADGEGDDDIALLALHRPAAPAG